MTSIEWTDHTWNPTVGCSRVSPGCDGCYAISVAHRAMQPAHQGLTIRAEAGPDWTGQVRCLPERLPVPLRRRRPARWFVDSMSDLFHPAVPEGFIGSVWATMTAADWHTFQVLTKRPQRMATVLAGWAAQHEGSAYGGPMWQDHEYRWHESATWPLPNVWLGTSIESDRYAWRAHHLRATPAAVRWLSLEPLLGPLPSLDLTGIDWVVAGGESGAKARPMHPDWVRDIRDRCQAASIPFLFKQWGAWIAYEDSQYPLLASQHGHTIDGHDLPDAIGDHEPTSGWWWPENNRTVYRRVGKAAAGRTLDGRVWHQFPGDLGRHR